MTRLVSFTLLAAFGFVAPTRAELLTFSGNASGKWVNPIGGVSSGAGTSTLMFGDNNKGSLRFDTNATFSTPETEPFRLGQITLFNNSPTNIPSQATLHATLTFLTPSLGPKTFDFVTTLASDGHGGITATVQPGSQTIFTGGEGSLFQLTLLGLSSSSTSSSDVSGVLTAPMCTNKTANVWAEVSKFDPTPQVPEPTSLALGAIGLGLIALRRFRK